GLLVAARAELLGPMAPRGAAPGVGIRARGPPRNPRGGPQRFRSRGPPRRGPRGRPAWGSSRGCPAVAAGRRTMRRPSEANAAAIDGRARRLFWAPGRCRSDPADGAGGSRIAPLNGRTCEDGSRRRLLGVARGFLGPARRLLVPEHQILGEGLLATEQRTDGLAAMYALDRLSDQGRDRERLDLRQARCGRQRDRVGDNDLADARSPDSVHSRIGQDAMRGAGIDLVYAFPFQRVHDLDQCAGRVYLVVDDDCSTAAHLADDIHQLRLVEIALAPLLDDGQRRAQRFREGPG